jgi:hypothetical protein
METDFAMLLLPHKSGFEARSFEFDMKVCGCEVWTNELASKRVSAKQRMTFEDALNISRKTLFTTGLHVATRSYISVFARRLERAVRQFSVGVRSQLEADE